MNILTFSNVLLCFLLVLISISDIKFRVIPFKYVFIGLLYCFFVAIFKCANEITIVYAENYFINLVISALPIFLIILATNGKMGGGDMKLFAMIGVFLGFKPAFVVFFISIILGGLFGVFLIILNKKNIKSEIAFGPFISLGVLILLLFKNYIFNFITLFYGITL